MNKNCITISIKKIALILVLLGFVFQSLELNAQNHVTLTNVNSSNILVNAVATAYENNYFVYASGSGSSFNQTYNTFFRYRNAKNRIELKIDRTAFGANFNSFSTAQQLEIKFDIVYVTASSNGNLSSDQTISDQILSVNYDPSANAKEKEVDVFIVPDAVYSRITIKEIKLNSTILNSGLSINSLPVTFTNGIDVEIDEHLNIGNFSASAVSLNHNSILSNGCQSEVTIGWNPFLGAKNYELEWVFVDYWVQTKTQYNYDFKNNSTRIRVSGNSYTLPLIYEKGYILYRLRAVGYAFDNDWQEVCTPWTIGDQPSAGSGCQGPVDLTGTMPSGCGLRFFALNFGFQENKNWQFSVAYTEHEKSKGVISYMDGTLRQRQSISLLNSENKVMVSQTIYDFLGRPAIQPLPVPDLTGDGTYCFRPDFNKSRASLEQYNWRDFDVDKSSKCTETRTAEMDWQNLNTSAGAAWYYSQRNSLISSGTAQTYEKFIPDAEGYPFVQTEYTPDNTGRIKRVSGLGKYHRLIGDDDLSNSYLSSHETKYLYGKPTQEELDLLFGNDVGKRMHYEKTVAIDPNGQASVSYTDAYGRVIATALTGDPAQSPAYKPLSTNSNKKTISTSYENTFIRMEDNSLVTSEDVIFTSSSVHQIQYTMIPEILSQECMPNGVCFTCVYDLTISITNECGEQMLSGGVITRKVGNIVNSNINNACTAVQFTVSNSPLLVNLPAGKYHIEKTLTVNKESYEAYKDQYLANSNCVKTFDEFLAEEEAKINSRECNYDCNTCQQDLAFYDAKIAEHQQRIQNYSNNDPISLEVLTAQKAEMERIREVTDQACSTLCKAPNTCDQLYTMMLYDVAPNGQYGLVADANGTFSETMAYSVYNNTNNHWRSPEFDYKDDLGKVFLIEIKNNQPEQVSGANYFDAMGNAWANNGPKFIKPQGLKNLKDFLFYYQNSWAKSLAIYHPEYSCYTSCQQTSAFYDYDNLMFGVSTFAQANSLGMINPINSVNQGSNPNNQSVYLGYLSANNVNERDPVFSSTLSINGASLKSLIDEKLHNVITHNGVTYTAWQLMELYRAQIDEIDGHCADDLLWYYFRALYQNAKSEVLRQYFDASACSVPYEDINAIEPKDRRFFKTLNVQDLVKQGLEQANQGLMNGNPEYIKNNVILAVNSGEIAKKCEKNCNLYADQWMVKLTNCQNVDPNFTQGSTLWNSVKSKLIGVCKDGCDQSHPFGSSSIDPVNTTATHTSFKDVLMDLSIFQLGVCDDIAIDWPMPYGHDYFAYESADAVNCACDNSRFLLENKLKIKEKCHTYEPAGEPFNDCACDKKDAQKKHLILLTKDIPKENRCNTCYTCVEITTAAKKYNEEYGTVIPVTHDAFAQTVTNYINKYLSLNISFSEYTNFLVKCLNINEDNAGNSATVWESAINNPIGFSQISTPIELDNQLKIYNQPYQYINSELWYASMNYGKYDYPQYMESNSTLLASMDGAIIQGLSMTSSTQSDNVKCNCKKILNAWKTAESSGRPFQDVMAQMYPGFTPVSTADALKLQCLQLYNGYNQNSAGGFTGSINDYDLNGKWTQAAENAINDDLAGSTLNDLKDKSCTDDADDGDLGDLAPLDDCACKKILEYKAEYDALPANTYSSFNEFMNQVKRVSSDPGFDKLYKECLRYYQTSLGEDANGNPVQYNPTIPFNQEAKDHLKKDVNFWGYKVAKKLLCPPPPPPPGPGTNCNFDCNEIRNWLSNYYSNHWIPEQYRNQFSLYRAVEQVYLMSKDNATNPNQEASQWLTEMANQFNMDYDNNPKFNKCKPFQYTAAQIMELMAPCMPPCPDLTCEALDKAVKDFIAARIAANNNPNPVFIPESFTDFDKSGRTMAYELINYYNHTQGDYTEDRNWTEMTSFMNDFISSMNTSFSNAPFCTRNFTVKFLADMLHACNPGIIDVGKTQSPCDVCFTYNTNIKLTDLQAYLNQIAKGDGGQSNTGYDKLDMSNWKLYSTSTSSNVANITAYYGSNSSLYTNGNDLPNLRYFTAGYPTPPQLFATVQDNNGHLFQYALYMPGSQPWLHWGEIIKFKNIRIIDPKKCTVPNYFAMDVDIFMSPAMYKYFKSVTGITINNDNSNLKIDDLDGYKYTITITGSLVSQKIATKVPCPGPCYKLCNKPVWPEPDEQDVCSASQLEWAYNNASIRYEQYLKTKLQEFEKAYYNKCLGVQETFTDQYDLEDFHYTLYYYDRAGMLTKTVPPQGVDVQFLTSTQVNSRLSGAKLHRTNPTNPYQITAHNLETFNLFGSLGNVIFSHSPDAGNSRMWYDKLGRLVATQNSVQFKRCNPIPGLKTNEICAYIQYDELGRNKEVGEKIFVYSPQVGMCTGVLLNTCLFAGSTANIVNNFYQYGTNTQVTRTVFDKNTIGYFSYKQLSNLRNRNAYIEYLEDGNNLSSGTYFSYDLLGNVKTLWQYSVGLDRFNNQGYKRIDYSYDLVSGNTNQVSYQKGEIDQFYHQYTYDLDDRLTCVKTSKDGEIWQQDASYKYLKHGPMARKVLGEFAVQGVDMAYTINGWIKNVNSDAMDAEHDMGADAALNGVNSARDAYGFSLHYFDGDFKSIDLSKQNLNVSAISGFAGSDLGQNRRNLFNGNISAMVTTLPFKNNYQSSGIIQALPMATVYQYDQLNRLAEVRVFENYNTSSNTWGMNGYNGLSQYAEQFEYDANGNITHLKRNGHQIGATMPMDDLSYNYLVQNGRLISNKLYSVDDGVAGSNYTSDIDDQANFNNNLSTLNTANNYGYDDLGNLIRDNAEEIAEIKWNLNGKIAEIKRTTNSQKPDLEFGYDAFGRRQYKLIKPKDNTGNIKPMKDWIKKWYICDVDGNVMANYEQSFEDNAGVFKEKLKVTDHAIYGSERLGNYVKDEMLGTISYSISGYNTSTGLPQVNGALTQQTFTLSTSNFSFVSGNKNYELSNHLSNVLAVVQDRKLPIDDVVYSSPGVIDYYLPVYNSFGLYYAYGSPMPEKDYQRQNLKYKFGFNGQEKDDEVSGNGNSNTAEFWQYDTRVGRRYNVDPIVKEYESSYSNIGDNPIWFVDPKGADTIYASKNAETGIWEIYKKQIAEGNDIFRITYINYSRQYIFSEGEYGKRFNVLNLENTGNEQIGYTLGVYHISGHSEEGATGFVVTPGGEPSVKNRSLKRLPDDVYSITGTGTGKNNSSFKWVQPLIQAGIQNTSVGSRAIKIHPAAAKSIETEVSQWTDGCYIVSTNYSLKKGKVYYNSILSKSTSKQINGILGATKNYDSVGNRGYPGSDFSNGISFKLIQKSGF